MKKQKALLTLLIALNIMLGIGLFSVYINQLKIARRMYRSETPEHDQTASRVDMTDAIPLNTVIEYQDAEEWPYIKDQYAKTIYFSFRYPQDLYAKKGLRGHDNTFFFFPHEQAYQDFEACLNTTTADGKGVDWEASCDLNNLLFKVKFTDGGVSLEEELENSGATFSNYIANNKRGWLVTDSLYNEELNTRNLAAELTPTNTRLNKLKVYIEWPNLETLAATENVTGVDARSLFFHLISVFEYFADL